MLTAALTAAPTPKPLLEEIAAALPYPTLALAGTAAEVFQQLATETPASSSECASLLVLLSNSLGDLGRREEALTAIEEAVTAYHALAQAQPNAFLPDLAMSLNNRAGRLSDLGRRGEALTASEEAVAAYRALADTHPDTFLPNLAASLTMQSSCLSDLGRREEALTVIKEAVTTYRALADTHPGTFLSGLGLSLNNQSNRLSDLGRHDEALTAIEEAVSIRRTLAQVRPDAFLPDLAMSLINQSSCLSNLGRREEALTATEEAVAAYRGLADTHPNAFLPNLAMALNNQSLFLGACIHPSTKCCLCSGGLRLDADVPEERLHADPEVFVVAVDGGPDLGLAAHAGAADAGHEGRDDVVAEGEQRGDEAGAVRRNLVAAGPAGLVDEVLAAELAQVVSGLPDGVAVMPGHLAYLGGVLGGGEPARCRGERQRR
jgi:tetratricopeptide (TPR) repeat protein